MRSVGEAMAIGRTFKEALQKALRSLETGATGLVDPGESLDINELARRLVTAGPERVFFLKRAIQIGLDVGEIHRLTGIDPWFLDNLQQIVEFEKDLRRRAEAGGDLAQTLPAEILFDAKRCGFSDAQLAELADTDEEAVRQWRTQCGLLPSYKCVDTCAAEFEAFTPYYYSTYEPEDESFDG